MSARQLEPPRGLEVDVDLRMADVWAMAWDADYGLAEKMAADPEFAGQVGAFLRMAYGRGYVDALREDKAGQRAELHKTHGYQAE